MAVGIEIYNSDGSLQFDITNRLLRVLVLDLNTTTAAGSTTVPNQGTLIPAFATNEAGGGNGSDFSTTSTTVSWTSSTKTSSGNIMVF